MSDSDSESKPFAVQSAETIREVRKYYREKIEFLGGSSLDPGQLEDTADQSVVQSIKKILEMKN
jgi:hypothetical protein